MASVASPGRNDEYQHHTLVVVVAVAVVRMTSAVSSGIVVAGGVQM